MTTDKPLIEEAVRLLSISDTPDLYHRLRRWAREHIRHQANAPIDTINWPKGCLMCGLMHRARRLQTSDTSMGRALSVYACACVQDYIDKWIKAGTEVCFVDDALAGQAILMLAEVYRNEDAELYDRYMNAASIIMDLLRHIDEKWNGIIPYRPAQGTGVVFADSCGEAAPFAVRYGLMKRDDDCIDLGLRMLRTQMEFGYDRERGIPLHYFSPLEHAGDSAIRSDGGSPIQSDGVSTALSVGWGRALGWLAYGLGASAEALTEYEAISPMEIKAQREIHTYIEQIAAAVDKYGRADRLIPSVLWDHDAPVDTSASAMVIYGLSRYSGTPDISPLEPYITGSGRVTGAQGECMGPGIYSDTYDSYPWSVGMTLML